MRVLVRNPNSGDGKRSARAADLARDRGFDVRDSTRAGETYDLAREAAVGGAELVAACGGDGTLNEVVHGVDDADRLDDTELGVVPAGTGNDFADNVGIRGVDHAFEVLESGERRRIDLGSVDLPADPEIDRDDALPPRPFLNSCVGGLTAESSARTKPASKRRLGVLAYVLTTMAHTRGFEGLELEVRVGSERDPTWEGTAAMLLVGNGRRFPGEQRRQANMEDGKLNVVVVEDAPAIDYLARGAADRFLRRGASHLTRVKASSLVVDAARPRQFSLDGELVERRHVEFGCRPRAMRFAVGEAYDTHPEENPPDVS
ncbi:YegS/Rv2252/BmrU family lipid kinase [Halobaculum sp. WSA2]|uniref:YegS/Rv2252/BmrU family lipid kinase n=1 Tax=Halobaculum saliterrae TaxID=2073113 RepID=A0A6B0SNF2_9EURY|nr:YegS/Rv2252/BmrU family lipid kinase [Halobaculum saliterrae]MXR39907.1 YegS/Rv2252/BmrU family lipid kinase [Halobaculum saliterrae]